MPHGFDPASGPSLTVVNVGPLRAFVAEGGQTDISCECGWRCTFATMRGAEQRMSEHALRKHKLRLVWSPTQVHYREGKGE